MTWYDHTTFSIWSQPTGEVLAGPLEGTKLKALPFQLTTWTNWVSTYPQTLVMSNDLDRIGNIRQGFEDDFLIGVIVADFAKAYPFLEVASQVFIEDQIGDFPIIVWAKDEDYRVFLRQVGDQEVHFSWEDGALVDQETGSRWDPQLGLAREGQFQGEVLQQLPSLSIWRSFWFNFYPQGEIYQIEN
jgi:hypothetical protein